MAGILDYDINSSDNEEDDCNYEPEIEGASEDSVEDSEEEYVLEENEKNKKMKEKNKSVVEDETDDIESKEPGPSEIEKKKREESIWESFKHDVRAADIEKKGSKDEKIEKLFTDIDGNNKLILLASVASKAFKSENMKSEENDCESKNILKSEVDFNSNIKEVQTPSDESDNKPQKSQPNPGIRKRAGGLGSLIGSITNKKQKLSTLDKSALDWKMYKKEEGIEEDLERFNKGKGGYLENQAFLQRSDLRQFRLERDIRLSSKRKL